MNKIETILHPVRFKIIQCFLDGQQKTAKKLANELHDIPQATLYRQLDALVKGEVLHILEENQIRGTVEKVYTLANAVLTNEDIKEVSVEEHLQYFMLFTAQLVKDFETYLQKDDIDFQRDGVGYRQIALHLSDEEFMEFVKEMSMVFQKYINYQQTPERTKRVVSTIIIPNK